MDDFDLIADYYDMLYVDDKEYKKEAEKIITLEKKYNLSGNRNLLDIGCGTGEQTKNLSDYYKVTGIDLSDGMLRKAVEKLPNDEFYKKNMFDFELTKKYGVAINLFGSIGFAKNYSEMVNGLRSVWTCLDEGGILILTPWDTKETYSDKTLVDSGKKGDVYFSCMENVVSHGNKVEIEMIHLIAKENRIKEYHYTQRVTLFSEDEYLKGINTTGYEVCERIGINDFRMGAFICRKIESSAYSNS